ncbi:FKBP-type peptidyl-prolyl cis-trans isomerase [Candidatus Omnitrophota bacterium]
MKILRYIFILVVVLSSFWLLAGCGPSAVAKSGDTVKVHYTGRLNDNTVFDTSVGSEPMEFTLGDGRLIPGFEQAVTGMQVGESKTVTIRVDEAYGQRRDDLIFEVERDKLTADIEPEVGMQLPTSQGTVTIIEVSEKTIRIDANHPLAGQDLTFDIELIEIGASQSDTTESGLTSMPLEQALENGLPTIADFGRGTCIPCKQMKPILEDLAKEYEGKVNVLIISVDEHRDLTTQYGIMAIPTQIFLDSEGQEVTRHMGFFAKDDIIAQLLEMGIE